MMTMGSLFAPFFINDTWHNKQVAFTAPLMPLLDI